MSDDVARAVDALRRGGLVAFPTETVYGLGADATSAEALQRLYDVKRRPANHPVIVHVARVQQLHTIAVDVPDIGRTLARAFWPGPLTLVVRKRAGVIADAATGGRETVGVRIPDHPLAFELLDAFAGPVAAPSANRFGKVSPTTAAHVRADLNADVDIVLDGGECGVGVESTIVDVTVDEPRILRLGGVSEEQLSAVVGHALARANTGAVAAPGALASHYAPSARVVTVAAADLDTRVRELRAAGTRVAVLDAPADLDAYAHVLYARLRELDSPETDVIVTPLPPDDGGIGAVIRDRLERAGSG